MPPQSSSPAGRSEPGWPGGDDWPGGDEWPDDGEPSPSGPDPAEWPMAAGGPPAGSPPGGGRRRRWLTVSAVAVLAAAAGAGITLAALPTPSASPPLATAPSSSAPFTGPGPARRSGGIPGGGPASSNGTEQLILGGAVRAVSGTSITIDGGGHDVVAAVTSSTRFTGRVKGIGSVRVGDMVAAEMTVSDGKAIAVAIQDPAAGRPGDGSGPGGG